VIDPETFEHMAKPNPYINQAVNFTRAGGDDWQASAKEALQRAAETGWGKSILQENPAFKELFQRLETTVFDQEKRVEAIREIETVHSF
jgi:hypothetical protein